MNPIVYAIPVFFALMAFEWVVAHRRGVTAYRLGDMVSSVGLGAMSQVTGLFAKLILIGIYALIYEHARVTTLPVEAWWVWVVGLLLYDFLYYWDHRLSHEVGVLWASHVVHHQSEDFNLSTALRQTSTEFLFGWIFYVPMALLGFPPLVFVVVALVDLLYQYWIHTEQIGKLGWFDRVFASPSNHRVHHGVNDYCLDRNYGGILILWDRMFGSFADERDDEKVIYGTRSPLKTYDPLWANVEVYAALCKDAWHARRWRDKLKVFLKHPGWRPDDVAARDPKPPFDIARLRKHDPRVGGAVTGYVAVQFGLSIAAGTHCIAVGEHLSIANAALYTTWVCATLWSLSALLEARRGALAVERIRLIAAAALALLTLDWFGTGLDRMVVATIVGLAFASLMGTFMLKPRLVEAPSLEPAR